MRNKLSPTILATLIICLVPMHAHAGLLEFLFPASKGPTYDPYKTLTAPFADNPPAPEDVDIQKQLNRRPEDAVALDQPHISERNVSQWIVTATSNAMTFDAQEYQQDLQESYSYFSKGGFDKFKTFLKEKSFAKILESQKYYIRSFVEQDPLLINKGPLKGSYRWLYEVPMMITYMDRSMTDYKDARPINQRMVLRIQVGRVRTPDAPHTLQVELWSGDFKKDGEK